MPQVIDSNCSHFHKPGNYLIRVLGSLGESFSDRLGGFRIRSGSQKDKEKAVTELVGQVRDQAELVGILETLYDLHLMILLVEYQDE